MELVERTDRLESSLEVWQKLPIAALAMEQFQDEQEQDGTFMGIWRDGHRYLVGTSRTEEEPEEVSMVMTKTEWRRRQEGKDIPYPETLRMTKRALAEYGERSTLGKMLEEMAGLGDEEIADTLSMFSV